MHYKCSTCFKPMGVMLDRKGKPELFKCPYSGRVSYTIPERPVIRDTPPLPKWLIPEDLSRRAVKHQTVEEL